MEIFDPTADRAKEMLDAYARADVMAADCPSRPVLQHLTSRWGVLVMAALATGTHRFSELRRRIGGVSERMLAQTLQQLEGDGFVLRRDYGEVPPRVDYSLTPLGEGAAVHLVALASWIEANFPAIAEAQAALSAPADRSVPASA
ncbi:winged helix-turn-helix transcriptional regulator [Pararhodobacter aggregans]|nr:helix-turn-helix domain-containing protein [Pararhodobacter aggregans]PTX00743.1 HxlR family transcriptional regulator [Pararhodobacter aggregans]